MQRKHKGVVYCGLLVDVAFADKSLESESIHDHWMAEPTQA